MVRTTHNTNIGIVKNNCFVCSDKCRRDQNSFKCYGCVQWVHATCLGIGPEECKFVSKVELNFEWVCSECRDGKNSMQKDNFDLKRMNVQLGKYVQVTKQKCTDLEK